MNLFAMPASSAHSTSPNVVRVESLMVLSVLILGLPLRQLKPPQPEVVMSVESAGGIRMAGWAGPVAAQVHPAGLWSLPSMNDEPPILVAPWVLSAALMLISSGLKRARRPISWRAVLSRLNPSARTRNIWSDRRCTEARYHPELLGSAVRPMLTVAPFTMPL